MLISSLLLITILVAANAYNAYNNHRPSSLLLPQSARITTGNPPKPSGSSIHDAPIKPTTHQSRKPLPSLVPVVAADTTPSTKQHPSIWVRLGLDAIFKEIEGFQDDAAILIPEGDAKILAPLAPLHATPTKQYPNIWVLGDSVARWYAVQCANRLSQKKGINLQHVKWYDIKNQCHGTCTMGAGVTFGWTNWFGKGFFPYRESKAEVGMSPAQISFKQNTEDICTKDMLEEQHCHDAIEQTQPAKCGMEACLTSFFSRFDNQLRAIAKQPTSNDVCLVRIGLFYLWFSKEKFAQQYHDAPTMNINQTLRADLLSFIAPLHRAFKGKIIWMLLAPVSQEFVSPVGLYRDVGLMDVNLVNNVLKEVLAEQKQEHIIDPTPFHTKAFMKSTTPTLDVGDGHVVEGYMDPFHFGGSALDNTIDAIFEEIEGFHDATIDPKLLPQSTRSSKPTTKKEDATQIVSDDTQMLRGPRPPTPPPPPSPPTTSSTKPPKYFPLNRTDHACRYMTWRYEIKSTISWGHLIKDAPRLVPLFAHLNCDLWIAISTLHGALLNKNARQPRPTTPNNHIKVCAGLRAMFFGFEREHNVGALWDDVLSQKDEHGNALWVTNVCDVPLLEAEASQNLRWTDYLFNTRVLHHKDKDTTDNNKERFLLWDFIWGMDDIGENAGMSWAGRGSKKKLQLAGFGNIFASLTTAVVTAALTNRTLVLPPTRIAWGHGGGGFRDLYEAFAFRSYSFSSAEGGRVKVLAWNEFVTRMLTDPTFNNNNNNNSGVLCKDTKDICILDAMHNHINLMWYDVPNPTTAIHYDNNGRPSPPSPEFEAARSLSQRHHCTDEFKKVYDPLCTTDHFNIAPLPGIFDMNGQPLAPPPTFLYIPAAFEAYWIRFSSIDRQKTLRILHETVKFRPEIEAIAKEVATVLVGPQEDSQDLGGTAAYDCVHMRRGDVLLRPDYPTATTSVVEEVKRVATHLKSRAKVVPVYFSVEDNSLSTKDMQTIRTQLKRPVVFSPAARKQVCDAKGNATEDDRMRKEACERVGAYVDIVVCRNARLFIGSFRSTFTNVIQEFRLWKHHTTKVRLLNGPPGDSVPKSWLSWWNGEKTEATRGKGQEIEESEGFIDNEFCIINWKKHNVKPGVTWEEKPWGTLPVALRKEWLQRGCNEIVGKQKLFFGCRRNRR
jgi:hypothetical protein